MTQIYINLYNKVPNCKDLVKKSQKSLGHTGVLNLPIIL